jgi:dihydropteroate synthase
MRRVLPVVEGLAGQVKVPLSVDTYKPPVAEACLTAGAQIINDVTALADPAMVQLARDSSAAVILMHMQGTPQTMQEHPSYADVVGDIKRFLQQRLHQLAEQGIAAPRVVVDPGIGFGKTLEHNLEILSRLGEFGELGRPVCLGASRKGFIGRLLDRPVEERLAGSLAVVCLAMSRQAVQIARVHDVAATRDAVTLWAAIAEFGAARGMEH